MSNLTDTQLVILSTAAHREDGSVLPLSKSLKVKGGAATSSLKSLLKKGLVAERPAAPNDTAWREAEDGRRVMLGITEAGLRAIGVEPDLGAKKEATVTKTRSKKRRQRKTRIAKDPEPKTKTSLASARPGTKQALLIDLLHRPKGATVAEIGQATGWQPHSVRGAISGTLKKKLGLVITSEKDDGRGRVYRIEAAGQ